MNSEILEVIRNHTEDDNGFTYDEQVEFTQELLEEFFDMRVSLKYAEKLYIEAANNLLVR